MFKTWTIIIGAVTLVVATVWGLATVAETQSKLSVYEED